MSKYNRHQPVVSRQAESFLDEDNWINKITKSLEKNAVQPKKVDDSLFQQINSIMNTRSKYPSVAAAVEEMKERSGLTSYLDALNKVSETEASNKKNGEEPHVETNKKAFDNSSVTHKPLNPVVIQKFPAIKQTIENYIRDTKGNIPVPAIIEKVKAIHRKDVSDPKDWDDDQLIRLISQLNLQAKKNNPSSFEENHNLGSRNTLNDSEIDPSNTDAFSALNPVKL